MHIDLRLTEDGSHTIFLPSIDETYHSTHGAIQESNHIFIERAFKQINKPNVNVLEIGFGTGLNAFLTLVEAIKNNQYVFYETIELYPIQEDVWSRLNYSRNIAPELEEKFVLMQASKWDVNVEVSPEFVLKKYQSDFLNFSEWGMYDVIYFDAFSPEKQPEMWQQKLFEKLYHHCNVGAILTTYCAKGDVRRALKAAGFQVERLEGPPGKREILRAQKL